MDRDEFLTDNIAMNDVASLKSRKESLRSRKDPQTSPKPISIEL